MATTGFKLKVLVPVAITLVFGLVLIEFQNAGVDKHCRAVPRSPAVPSQEPKTAEEFLKRGGEVFDAGNCNEAIALYTHALALNPDYAEAYNNRAYANMRMQNYAPALKDLDQALRIRPEWRGSGQTSTSL